MRVGKFQIRKNGANPKTIGENQIHGILVSFWYKFYPYGISFCTMFAILKISLANQTFDDFFTKSIFWSHTTEFELLG